MNRLRHQNYKNENTQAEILWYDWLNNYIPEFIERRRWCIKKKL